MALDDQSKPFGLREVRITNAAGDTQAVLDASQTFTFAERVMTNELKGSDKTQSVVSFADGVEWSLEEGGIPLQAYAIMTGRTLVSTGTSPAIEYTLSGSMAECFPYFKVYGRAVGEGCTEDVHCKLGKCKLTGNIEGEFAQGEFWVTSCSGIAIDDSSGVTFQFVSHETAEDLPSS